MCQNLFAISWSKEDNSVVGSQPISKELIIFVLHHPVDTWDQVSVHVKG